MSLYHRNRICDQVYISEEAGLRILYSAITSNAILMVIAAII